MKRILADQRSRFIIVGFANTAIDFSLLFILKFLGLPVLASNVISTTSAFGFSFIANKKFTFKSVGSAKREFILFTVVTLFGLWVIQSIVINLILIGFEGSSLPDEIQLFIAKVFATIASLIWNYVLYSRLVFKK